MNRTDTGHNKCIHEIYIRKGMKRKHVEALRFNKRISNIGLICRCYNCSTNNGGE